MTDTEKVTIGKFDVYNYIPWSIKIKFLLVTKGLWAAIDGAETDDIKSQKALALIGLHVKDHHLSTINACRTAKEAWDKLQTTYKAKTEARRMQLRRDLTSLRMHDGEPLTKYFSRATDIRDQLEAIGHTVDKDDLRLAILSGLPKEYETAVQIIVMTHTATELPELLHKLLPIEQQYTQKVKDEHTAFSAQSRPPYKSNKAQPGQGKGPRCFGCNQYGHIRKDCPENTREKDTKALVASARPCCNIAF